MKKLFFTIVSIFILIQCIPLALSGFRVESEPLENKPHYSVVNAPLFVFSDSGDLRLKLYNNTDKTINIDDHALHPYKVMDKNGALTNLDAGRSITSLPSQPIPVPAHGRYNISYGFAIGKLRPGKYKMQAAVSQYGESEAVFPSAEFEFYYIPLPFYIF